MSGNGQQQQLCVQWAGANLSAKHSYTELGKAKAVFAFSEDGKKANDVRNSAKVGEGLPKGDLQQGRILY